jgi:hypothetical protein
MARTAPRQTSTAAQAIAAGNRMASPASESYSRLHPGIAPDHAEAVADRRARLAANRIICALERFPINRGVRKGVHEGRANRTCLKRGAVPTCPFGAPVGARKMHASSATLAEGAAHPPPPDAISCLGAFRTPTAGARGEIVIAGVRKPAHNRTHAVQQRRCAQRRNAEQKIVVAIASPPVSRPLVARHVAVDAN